MESTDIKASGFLKGYRCKTLVQKKRFESYKQRKASKDISKPFNNVD